jgi:D-sedoheptulose 7-phosphate isomerase
MNNLERMVFDAKDIHEFSANYIIYLAKLLERIDTNAIEACIEELEIAHKEQNTVFIIGNGGSAATSSHMANDLGTLACNDEQDKPFCVLSLTDNVAAITAAGNDFGFEDIFIRQLQTVYKPGDRLIVISASGNSENVIATAKWVKHRNGKVIGLVGFDGGKLKDYCDILIHIETPKGEYGPVEDAHMILDHLMSTWLHYKKKEGK